IATAHNITNLEVPRYGDPRNESLLVCHYVSEKGDPPLHSVKNIIFIHQPTTRTFNTSTAGGVVRDSCNRDSCSIALMLPRTYNSRVTFTSLVFCAVVLKENPVILGVPSSVQLGEDVLINCTTSPAMPPANIMWFIDGKPERTEPWLVNNTQVSSANEHGLRSSWRALRIRVGTTKGYIGLRCEATQPTWPPFIRAANASLVIARSPHLSMFTAS
ncbi:Uncharacterized protein OBRU01_25192, partial [Operophtera brumata]